MPTESPLARRTFRLTIDLESTLDQAAEATTSRLSEGVCYQQALVQQLQAHPQVLQHLLRAWAIDALQPIQQLLHTEYGWGRASDQQLLQPIIAELEPAAQAYFTEELEDGAQVYSFDGYTARVKRWRLSEGEEN